MRKTFLNLMRLPVTLAIVCGLVAIVVAPASAAAVIMVSPGTGKVGTPIAITAAGFAPNSPLSATFGGVPVATVPASVVTDGAGVATFSIVAPARPFTGATPYVISVTDGANVASGNFIIQPAVAITAPATKEGPVGTSITVKGTGFTAGVTGFAMFEAFPGNVTLGSALVDSNGNFEVSGVVPASIAGAHKVWGYDLGSPTPANTYSLPHNDTFTVKPTLLLTPASGTAGTVVAITGSNWCPNASITILIAGLYWALVASDTLGEINTTAPVPYICVPGSNLVLATDGTHIVATNFVVLSGPEEQIDDILDFIDASLEEGSLEGKGKGNSAEGRLGALVNMLEEVQDLIDAGQMEDACEQLHAAYMKTDGNPRPPDFVTNDAAAELANKILDLMESLGCE